jgi:hypothetical protein
MKGGEKMEKGQLWTIVGIALVVAVVASIATSYFLDKTCNKNICSSGCGSCGSTYGAGTCESPSIRVGMRCCIDENDNNICDEDELSGNVLVCEKPYIKLNNDCCLDKNDNSICDYDETDVTCNKPYMKLNNWCCLDKNDNGICDVDEKLNTVCPKYYIADMYGSCCYDGDNNGVCDNVEQQITK